MLSPQQILQKNYGYDQFRAQQAEIIDYVIAGGDAFVLMPTGSGKSLCYQIPSLCRPGVGIVISPLIALMQDQVSALQQLGIRAEAINSSLEARDIAAIITKARSGEIDLLYVAPERLLMPDFLQTIEQMPVALFAIDEAHCVSQWGHDFRPHYAELSLLAERFPQVPRIALTATADEPTRKDIIERLGLGLGKTFIAGFDRPNIHYSIIPKKSPRQQLLDFIKVKHPDDSGIIYCLSRRLVEETSEWLAQQGLNAMPYHAGMNSNLRRQNQEQFLRGEKVIMVATIAFGMGIDKPDVRFVVHLSLPKNIEAYYQETGRSGRDGLPADVLMLYGMGDTALLRNFIDNSDAADQQKRIEHQKLNALLGFCEAVHCRRQVLLSYFGDHCQACGNCDNCQIPPETFDGSIAAQKAMSCVFRTGQRFGVSYLIDVLQGKTNERMVNFGHDKVTTFGIGAEYNKAEWQSYFRQLVARNLLMVAMTEHGGLKITAEGRQFLQQKPALPLRKYSGKNKVKSTRAKTVIEFDNDLDQALFAELKVVRLELAKAQSVPPYVIFHDKTLYEFTQQRPQSLSDMAMINGVGEVKLERYGKEFLALLVD